MTGANGFIGAAVCKLLRERKMPYTAAVRRAGSEEYVSVGELNGRTSWQVALEGCESVIHLAARVHVMREQSGNPLTAYREVNVDGTLNLARQSALAGVKRFIYVSSIKVNGESTTGCRPFTSFDAPAPSDAYGVSKLEAEQGLQALADEIGLEIVVVRPPLVYGPGVRANFRNLMRLVATGVPLPFGQVQNARSLVSVGNLADFLLLALRHTAAPGQIFLVSDGEDVSVPGLIRMIATSMNKSAHLLAVPVAPMMKAASILGRSGVADRIFGSLQVDISHACHTLGWRPPDSMREAIDVTVRDYLAKRK